MVAAQQELLTDDVQAADISHAMPDTRALGEQPATNPLMLLQQAVDRGMSPEQLKALVDLHEQWRAARAREAFNVAMNAIQAEMPVVVRDARNDKTGSGYVRLETLSHRVKPLYTQHGFALSFSEADSPREGWKRIVCHVTHIAGHGEERFIDLPVDGIGPKGNAIGGMNAVQGAISTGSYGQRVLTCRIFNITVADTDLDGEAPNPNPDPNAPKAQPRGQRDIPTLRPRIERIGQLWRAANPNASGDRAAWAVQYKQWAMEKCDRVFDASKESQWTAADCSKCEAALGVDEEGASL